MPGSFPLRSEQHPIWAPCTYISIKGGCRHGVRPLCAYSSSIYSITSCTRHCSSRQSWLMVWGDTLPPCFMAQKFDSGKHSFPHRRSRPFPSWSGTAARSLSLADTPFVQNQYIKSQRGYLFEFDVLSHGYSALSPAAAGFVANKIAEYFGECREVRNDRDCDCFKVWMRKEESRTKADICVY